jgi:predicted enzyme related to lactoylglutathione lyase
MSSPPPVVPVVIDRVDHLVLTVADIEQTIDFYDDAATVTAEER